MPFLEDIVFGPVFWSTVQNKIKMFLYAVTAPNTIISGGNKFRKLLYILLTGEANMLFCMIPQLIHCNLATWLHLLGPVRKKTAPNKIILKFEII